jgi:hypothetical protein
MPLLTRLEERGQIIPGGLYYEQMYNSTDFESLVQEYGPNDGLTGGSKEFIEKPHWHAAFLQCPVEESVDERIMNAPKGDTQLIALRDKIVKGATDGIRRRMAKRIYGCATDNEIDGEHTYMQGLNSALFPCESTLTAATTSQIYGGISRTTTVNTEWLSADNASILTAASISKSMLDQWMDACIEFDDEEGTYLIVMGPTLYRRLKSEFEAYNTYKPKGDRASQGFDSMTYNSVEIAKDFLLDTMLYTTVKHATLKSYGGSASTSLNAGLSGASGYAGTQAVYILNLDTWHLHYYADNGPDGCGPFEMTEPFDQSKVAGGVEKTLAHVKWKGNLTCDAPNRNMYRAQVS